MNASFLKWRSVRFIVISILLVVTLLVSAALVGAQDNRLNNQFLFEDGENTFVVDTLTGNITNVSASPLLRKVLFCSFFRSRLIHIFPKNHPRLTFSHYFSLLQSST
jgi:hypothetical protein